MLVEHAVLPETQVSARTQLRARCSGRPHPGPVAIRMLRLLGGAYRGRPGRSVAVQTGLVVLAVVAQLLTMLWLARWNGAFFDALEASDRAEVVRQIWMFLAIVGAWMLAQTGGIIAKRRFVITLRRDLTTRLIASWMAEGRHLRIRNLGGRLDNEDGRIAEDARVTCEMGVELFASMLYALLQFAVFIGVLWISSGSATLRLAGLEIAVPGYMVWIALLYAAFSAGITVQVGRPLVRATDARQAAEADLRAGLLASLAHSPAIALTEAEPGERRRLIGHFAHVGETWSLQSRFFRNLLFLSSGFGLLTAGLPLLILAPGYLAGAVSLGTVMELQVAFGQVVAALFWLTDSYPSIAQWEASAERVLALSDAVDDVAEQSCGTAPGRVMRAAENGPELAFSDVTVLAPTGETLVDHFSAVIRPSERVLLEANPQAAAALFRAIAGLSPWGAGRIELPEGATLMFLGERPYLPRGRLAEALADPLTLDAFPRPALVEAMLSAGVAHLVPLLDESAEWEEEIGIEDQQRLGFARCLLRAPDWILLHDATSAVGPAEEQRLLALLNERLPRTAVIAIAHRAPPEAIYGRRIVIQSG